MKIIIAVLFAVLFTQAFSQETKSYQCIRNCIKEHSNIWKSLSILSKCRTEEKCIISELNGKALECAKTCIKEEPECETTVKKLRRKFRSAEREERRELVEKVVNKLKEKYPDVEERVVHRFVRLLFSPTDPKRVCNKYEEIFKSESSEKKISTDIADSYSKVVDGKKKEKTSVDLISCLTDCVGDKYTWQELMEIVFKCSQSDDPLACAIEEFGPTFTECVERCFGDKESIRKVWKSMYKGKKAVAKKVVEISDDVEKKLVALAKKKSSKNEIWEFLGCIFECAKRELSIGDILEKIGNCLNSEDPYICLAVAFGEDIIGCAVECMGSKSAVNSAMKALKAKTKNHQKLVANLKSKKLNDLLDCMRDCLIDNVGEFILIVYECLQEENSYTCILTRLSKQVLECVVSCLNKKKLPEISDNVEKKLVSMVKKKENMFECLKKCVPENVEEVYKIVRECLEERAPLTCLITKLPRDFVGCVMKCLDAPIKKSSTLEGVKENLKKSDDQPTECEKSVQKARKKFASLEGKEKREFLFKVGKKLKEKHQEASDKDILKFLDILFRSRAAPRSVCSSYTDIFDAVSK